MKQQILELTKELIKYNSSEHNPQICTDILSYFLTHIPENFTIERFEKDGVHSALIYISETRPESFDLLFNTHLDIIPAKDFQFEPKIEGDRLIGAGANDMKGNLVAALYAFLEEAPKTDKSIAFQVVTDEEIGGFKGTKYQVDSGVRATNIIATEPTNFDIVYKAKGVLWIRFTTYGKTAHGAYPWRGENAIEKMIGALQSFTKEFQNPTSSSWQTSYNIANIQTPNESFNKIPDSCSVDIDIRFISEERESIIVNIQTFFHPYGEIEILTHEPSIYVEEDSHLISQIQDSTKKVIQKTPVLYEAQGTSDGRHFSPLGGKSVEFGAVGGGIGQDDEWISISSLEEYYTILKDIIKNI